jgi:hypothetical protein
MTCQLVLLLDTRRIEFEMPEDGLLEGSWSGLEGARSLGRNGTHDEHRDFAVTRTPAQQSGQESGVFYSLAHRPRRILDGESHALITYKGQSGKLWTKRLGILLAYFVSEDR